MKKDHQEIISQLILEIEKLIPVYMQNDEDRAKANGNVALCIIDNDGFVTGKVFGTNKIRGREAFKVAWTKASQVWITGMSTGEFEKRVFNNEIQEETYGIRKPDYIGWIGGQPVTLQDRTLVSVGFSGFRGVTDLEIAKIALSIVNQKL
jgi:glc operon protein GlcG